MNMYIYICGAILSGGFLALYFIDPMSPWCIVFCSIGASGIGAVLLAWLLEISNNRRETREKEATRKLIMLPYLKELTHIVCLETVLLTGEDEEFRQKIESQTMSEIIFSIERNYEEKKADIPIDSQQMFERFEQAKAGAFSIRKRALNVMGDSVNNVADNIHHNRTYSISEKLFSSQEISAIQELRLKFNELKKSESYSNYITNCVEFFAWLRIFEKIYLLTKFLGIPNTSMVPLKRKKVK